MCPYTAKQPPPPAAQVEVEAGVEAWALSLALALSDCLVSSPSTVSLSTERTWPRISAQLAERPWTYGVVSHQKTLVGSCIMSPEDPMLSEALIFSKSVFRK